ncbi:MAG: DNA-directed RNA polymerase subunit alpha [bacterium]
MENILLPSKVTIERTDKPNKARLIMEPCFQGYGTTVGNAMRRVLLSSLPGAAVTALKIKGVQHEFTAVPNVQEDVLELTLNLKQLRLKLFSEEPVRLQLRAKGKKEVTAADFEKNAAVEIANPELHIATLTSDDANFEIEVIVERGRGFSAIEDRLNRVNAELGLIQIDALFTPIKNVGYAVESARVGEITNFDKLVMDLETDGTIAPEEALNKAAKILINYFSLLTSFETSALPVLPEVLAEVPIEPVVEEAIAATATTEEAPVEEKPKRKRRAATITPEEIS